MRARLIKESLNEIDLETARTLYNHYFPWELDNTDLIIINDVINENPNKDEYKIIDLIKNRLWSNLKQTSDIKTYNQIKRDAKRQGLI
jgi:hypothetical protein